MIKTLTETSPASSGTTVSTARALYGLDAFDSIMIVAVLQGATGDTLDVYLQVSENDSTLWVDYAHFPQIAAGAAATTRVWTVSRHAQGLSLTTVGTGNTPALAANTIVGGDFGERMRVVFVAGASTSAGASQTIHLIGSASKRRV